MTGLRSSLGLVFLMTGALAFGETDSFSPVPGGGDEGSFPCSFGSLPSDIQNRLKGEPATWKVQEPESLSEYTRKTWAGKKPPGCPGIAEGLFQNTKAPSYAVLFVPVGHPEHNRTGFSETEVGFRLVVFTRKVGLSSYEATVVERSNGHGPSNYFIRKVPIGRFFNEESKREFQVQATEGILMVDSAEQEYEADIYFWSNGGSQWTINALIEKVDFKYPATRVTRHLKPLVSYSRQRYFSTSLSVRRIRRKSADAARFAAPSARPA